MHQPHGPHTTYKTKFNKTCSKFKYIIANIIHNHQTNMTLDNNTYTINTTCGTTHTNTNNNKHITHTTQHHTQTIDNYIHNAVDTQQHMCTTQNTTYTIQIHTYETVNIVTHNKKKHTYKTHIHTQHNWTNSTTHINNETKQVKRINIHIFEWTNIQITHLIESHTQSQIIKKQLSYICLYLRQSHSNHTTSHNTSLFTQTHQQYNQTHTQPTQQQYTTKHNDHTDKLSQTHNIINASTTSLPTQRTCIIKIQFTNI